MGSGAIGILLWYLKNQHFSIRSCTKKVHLFCTFSTYFIGFVASKMSANQKEFNTFRSDIIAAGLYILYMQLRPAVQTCFYKVHSEELSTKTIRTQQCCTLISIQNETATNLIFSVQTGPLLYLCS